ncbi:MAG: YlzJ-like family protein [Bacillus sp. (in: firmicutes)]
MTLYTIIPNEWVLQHGQEFSQEQENFYYKGILVTAERVLPFRYRIIKITSTDPNDYLMDEFQPGSYIEPQFIGQMN